MWGFSSNLLYMPCLCLSPVGTYWVYTVYPPSYTPGAAQYCQKTTFQFAFVVTTLVWAVLTLTFVCGGCFILLTCCKTVNARNRLIPSRNTFYGATSDFQENTAGDVWFKSWFMSSNVEEVYLHKCFDRSEMFWVKCFDSDDTDSAPAAEDYFLFVVIFIV